jgi:YD repeat-containing protein
MKIFKTRTMRLFSALLLITTFYCTRAQQPFNFIGSPSTQQSNSVVNQVNQFTGKIGLSVPLYSYASSKSNLKFNISIDYSSGGLNLNQDPSSVGTGWNLNAGGLIHREINGKPDDLVKTTPGGYDVSGYVYAVPINTPPCGYQYRSVGYYPNPDNKVNQDSEPDEFHFSFLGKAGSFNIPKGGIYVNGPKVVTKPQSNLSFSFTLGNKPWPIISNITEIQITDGNGIVYTFSGVQTTGRMKPRAVQESQGQPYYFFHNEYDRIWEDYITDWLLTKIRDNNSGEEITLTYEDFYGKAKFPTSIVSYTSPSYFYYKEYKDDRNTEYWGIAKRVKTISFANNDRVIFEYDANDRCDLYNNKALLNVTIKNQSTEISYSFNYTYYKGNAEINYTGCTATSDADRLSKWLFLKAVKKTVNSTSATIASFDYIRSSNKIPSATDNILPSRKTIWTGNRYGVYWSGGHQAIQDAYGFYNGGETPTGPNGSCNMVDPYWKMINFCDAPKIGYPEIGSIQKVTYPTGGSMSIEYEANNVLKNGVDQLSYGIRVKKVIQSDGINPANDITKEYKYLRTDGKSSGIAMDLPPHTYTNEERIVTPNVVYQTQVASSSTVIAPATISGSPVGYERVEEITPLGKSVSEFTGFTDYAPLFPTYAYPFANKQRLADWAYGLLKKQTILDQAGNIVKTTENNYNVVTSALTTPEYKSMKTAFQRETSVTNFGSTLDPAQCAINDAYWKFTYDTYYPITGRAELLSATEKDYLKDGSIVSNKTEYEYEPTTFNLKKISSTNSLNEKLEKIIFYPTDYSTNSDKYWLVLKGIKTLPVSSISVLTKPNGDKFIAGLERTDFKYAPDISVRPDKIVTMKSKELIQIPSTKTVFTAEENYGAATTKSTVDLVYDAYDPTGNVVQSTAQQITQSAIWDNEQKIIVAKANAQATDIAFSSFETVEKGQWDYSGSGFYDYHAPTGKKVFDLTNNTISKANLSASKAYAISYWSNSGPFAINGSSSPIVTGRSYNGWAYYKHQITGATTVTVSGNGQIDELRLHPANTRMTTITYQPLVGLTSESGIDGQITKYAYDTYGRLLSIKDEKGNIAKLYCYNSQGLPSACGDAPVFYNWSIPPYTTFTLYNKNCPLGTVSSPIPYDVPHGRYISFISQADADNQAYQDMLTFGQAIADRTTSACVSMTVYARLGYENTVSSGTYNYGDVVVRFYSDPAGTIPVTVNNLPINYSVMYSGNGSTTSYTQTASGTEVYVATSTLLDWQEYECDFGYWPCYYNYYSNNYTLDANPYYQVIY